MKKLEDIPKKKVFDVPEGYFDSLPTRIQARLVSPAGERHIIYRYRLQYALPVMLTIAAAIFWLTPVTSKPDVERMLASVPSDQLVAFLSESDITTDDLLNNVDFSEEEIEHIEAESYGLGLEDDDLSPLLDDVDLENL